MTCFYPIDCWRSRTPNESGKRSIVFRRADGYEEMALQVPCGKCAGCAADKAMTWAIRSYHESTLHGQNCFLTLTYNDDCLPDDQRIDKRHLQGFFKRLRHHVKFRYYACGEYGDKTCRPHYHAAIFGADFLAKSVDLGGGCYTNQLLVDTWGFGNVMAAEFNMSTACYVAGYVGKKIGKEDGFHVMSKGIGFNWLNRYYDDLARTGSVVIEGRELPIPMSYINKFEKIDPSIFAGVRRERRERFSNMTPDQRIDLRREVAAKEKYRLQRVNHQKTKGIV